MPSRRFSLTAGVCIVAALTMRAGGADYKREIQSHVAVHYRGLLRDYARAIARTVSTARQVYVDEFRFSMPDEIVVTAEVDPRQPGLLYTDGAERIFLRVRSMRELRQPSRTGTHHIYALCRELARMAMDRQLNDAQWLTTTGAEGWTHYMGSVVVDSLYGHRGRGLWPDRYEYLADGTRRLEAQLAASDPSGLVEAAGHWRGLAKLIRRRGFAALFRAMAEARVDPADPGRSVRDILENSLTDPTALAEWWRQSGSALFAGPGGSADRAETLDPKRLSSSRLIVRHDSDKASGRRHHKKNSYAVRFRAPAGPWYLAGVQMFVSRTVSRRAPWQDATVRLLDEHKNVVAEFKVRYTCLGQRSPQWVQMPVRPTRVPRDFIISIAMTDTDEDAYYVHYDRNAEGHSMIGLPGGRWRAIGQAEWMIRAELGRPMEADPLADPALWPAATQPAGPDEPTPTPSGKRKVEIKLH